MRRKRFRIRRITGSRSWSGQPWKVRDEVHPYLLRSFATHAAAIAYVSAVIEAEYREACS